MLTEKAVYDHSFCPHTLTDKDANAKRLKDTWIPPDAMHNLAEAINTGRPNKSYHTTDDARTGGHTVQAYKGDLWLTLPYPTRS